MKNKLMSNFQRISILMLFNPSFSHYPSSPIRCPANLRQANQNQQSFFSPPSSRKSWGKASSIISCNVNLPRYSYLSLAKLRFCTQVYQNTHSTAWLLSSKYSRMRHRISISIPLFLLPIAISALQIPPIFAPFYEAESRLEDSILQNGTEQRGEVELRRRDGGCPDNFNSCSTLKAAYGGACCTSGSVCTIDQANNVACCAIGMFFPSQGNEVLSVSNYESRSIMYRFGKQTDGHNNHHRRRGDRSRLYSGNNHRHRYPYNGSLCRSIRNHHLSRLYLYLLKPLLPISLHSHNLC
jgi:hypothetical protein